MYDAEDPAKVAGSSSERTANANCGISIAKVKGTAAGTLLACRRRLNPDAPGRWFQTVNALSIMPISKRTWRSGSSQR